MRSSRWPRYLGIALLPLLSACAFKAHRPSAPVAAPVPVSDLAEQSPTYWALMGEQALRARDPVRAAQAYARAAQLTDDVDLVRRGAE
ncbi:MAG: hypothetical protein WBV19_08805, partial [Candidatus Macondimonas sp.]